MFQHKYLDKKKITYITKNRTVYADYDKIGRKNCDLCNFSYFISNTTWRSESGFK